MLDSSSLIITGGDSKKGTYYLRNSELLTIVSNLE